MMSLVGKGLIRIHACVLYVLCVDGILWGSHDKAWNTPASQSLTKFLDTNDVQGLNLALQK